MRMQDKMNNEIANNVTYIVHSKKEFLLQARPPKGSIDQNDVIIRGLDVDRETKMKASFS